MKNKNIELLSPVGDFECLKAAVQNGADTVYFGASSFNARNSATNFDYEELKKAIEYAKTFNVKTNLTLNILIKDSEFDEALELATKAIEYGIDALIVQDFGLANILIKTFPDFPIHASTQMSIHNLEGALKLQSLGFKRVVLSRELSKNEITYICNNTNVEIEAFVHGALCISYSGQCLFSSMIGARSGNRGKCAQPCRLKYDLLETNHLENDFKSIDNGYLLSTKDLCGLEFLPELIEAGVICFKIEGRMKTPEYVATVTRIYRKYIDLALSDKPYEIDSKDLHDLMQVFNRGGFSTGHLSNEPNRNLIYKEKPNNMGLYLGNVSNYNSNKGHITLKLNEELNIGDVISFENESSKYTVSELMDNKNINIPVGKLNTIVKVGRMKGNIKVGDKIYKLTDKNIIDNAKLTYTQNPIKKIPLTAHLVVKHNLPITIHIECPKSYEAYSNISISKITNIIPEYATNHPLTKERLIEQLRKTKNTPYEFVNIDIDLEDNIYIPKISMINELRREVLSELELAVCNNKKIISKEEHSELKKNLMLSHSLLINKNEEISVLLQLLNKNYDYTKLSDDITNIYIPLKYFTLKKYEDIIKTLELKYNLYIYMPTIIKANYKNLFLNNIESVLELHKISGFVISNVADFELLKKYSSTYKFVGNYTLNVFNKHTINEYKKLGLSKFTISPEENKTSLLELLSTDIIPAEFMVYGNIPLMNMGYCLLGKSNKCYPECEAKCNKLDSRYYLKDRLGYKFRVIPDNIQTITSIYNCKTTFIDTIDLNIYKYRLNILDEDINIINEVVNCIKNKTRLKGKNYTNGNFNREV